MAQCNLCTLNQIKAAAAKEKKEVSVMAARGKMGGFDVFVHPKGIEIRRKNHSGEPYWRTYLMAIPESCCCDDDGVGVGARV